jgi:hypothetical protein
MVLVEPHAVVAEPVQQLPRLQVFGVGTGRDLRAHVLLGQRIRQLARRHQILQILVVGHEVEDEHLHGSPHHAAVRTRLV